MPPNKEGRCDSCNEESDVLIPLWVWDETECGEMMVEVFYCPECAEIRFGEATEEKEKKREEEEDKGEEEGE